jgi:hypothetical protein
MVFHEYMFCNRRMELVDSYYYKAPTVALLGSGNRATRPRRRWRRI